MTYLIGLLTVILGLDCVLLVLLILIQLPKKEAGLGTAFGGGATDALFGAGAGNALTKITTYATVIFFSLSLVLAVMNANRSYQNKSRMRDVLKQQAATAVTTNIAENPVKSAAVSNAAAATKAVEPAKAATTNLLMTLPSATTNK